MYQASATSYTKHHLLNRSLTLLASRVIRLSDDSAQITSKRTNAHYMRETS